MLQRGAGEVVVHVVAGREERAAAAWHPFAKWISAWLEPIPGSGFDAVRDAYLEVLDGKVAPDRAHVLTI